MCHVDWNTFSEHTAVVMAIIIVTMSRVRCLIVSDSVMWLVIVIYVPRLIFRCLLSRLMLIV